MAKIIVVTGGIGSGKSTVVKQFNEFFPTINADQIVHDAYNNLELKECQRIIELFGNDIAEDGKINRLTLREKLKTNTDYELLGTIWSDYVRRQLNEFTYNYADCSFVVWEVPLAIESGWTGDILIAVVAPWENRVERVMARSRLTYGDVVLRMKCQANIEDVIAQAAHIICNNCSVEELNHRVDVLANGLIDGYYK